MADNPQFSVNLTLLEGYKFEVDFGDAGTLITDEPQPLGENNGPNPSRLLAASVANCLAASLMFAIRKFKEDPGQVKATVSGEMVRQDNRWRIADMQVELNLGNDAQSLPHLERALTQFENFCVVTQSVRQGINVKVSVKDASGKVMLS
ncbi:OsmC family protein [Neptunicella marina]|uniref:OsmC family protein n=1 Tax=Neptunicella marina TaxID=2125989 RepID=A0A8J6IRI7_9ALTE|nr:OsmC family protein [Neptunicella marina]MBC3765094.1 OsmC family protein [Neptunicella marina]